MDYPYSTSFLMPLPGNPVKAVCQAIKENLDYSLDNANKTIIHGIRAGVNVYTNFTGKKIQIRILLIWQYIDFFRIQTYLQNNCKYWA